MVSAIRFGRHRISDDNVILDFMRSPKCYRLGAESAAQTLQSFTYAQKKNEITLVKVSVIISIGKDMKLDRFNFFDGFQFSLFDFSQCTIMYFTIILMNISFVKSKTI